MSKWPLHDSSAAKLDTAITKPAHAYILSGPEGIGSFRIALLFAARLLNKEVVGNILDFSHSNLIVVVPIEGKKKISVAQIHELISQVHQTTFDAKIPRVVIIEGSEKLSLDASAALLKTLEEPPGDTIFILATNNKSAMLSTIISRTITISLVPAAPSELASYIEQNHNISKEKALAAAKAAGGLSEIAFTLIDPESLQKWQDLQAKADTFNDGTVSEKFAIAKQVNEEGDLLGFLERLYFSTAKQSSILVIASNQELMLNAEKQFASNVNIRLILENMALTWSKSSDS